MDFVLIMTKFSMVMYSVMLENFCSLKHLLKSIVQTLFWFFIYFWRPSWILNFWRDTAKISRVSWHFWIQHTWRNKFAKFHAFITNLHTWAHSCHISPPVHHPNTLYGTRTQLLNTCTYLRLALAVQEWNNSSAWDSRRRRRRRRRRPFDLYIFFVW